MGSPLKPHLTEDEWTRFKRVAEAAGCDTPEQLASEEVSDHLQYIEAEYLALNRDNTKQIDVDSPLEKRFSENDWGRLSRVTHASEYDIPAEMIAEVISNRLPAIEDEYFEKDICDIDLFDYTFGNGLRKTNSPAVRFTPTKLSKIKFKYKNGNRGNTNIMDTETTVIGKDEIIEEMKEIEDVAHCNIPQTGSQISVYPKENIDTPLDLFAEEIHKHLINFIDEREERITSGDETKGEALNRAMRGYL